MAGVAGGGRGGSGSRRVGGVDGCGMIMSGKGSLVAERWGH